MRIERQRYTERFGSIKINDVQKVLELDSGWRADGALKESIAVDKIEEEAIKTVEERMAIVIPVKDEQANIGTCLESILAQDYPDARSAAKIVESIDSLLPQIQLDTKPLYAEAEKMEAEIKSALARVQATLAGHESPLEAPGETPPGMYR